MNPTRLLQIAILTVTLLVGCKEVATIEKEVFKEKWEDSAHHSAVTWWYLGENKNNYFIAEKWPTKQFVYSVTKQGINMKDVGTLNFDASNKPVNLKYSNVEFQ